MDRLYPYGVAFQCPNCEARLRYDREDRWGQRTFTVPCIALYEGDPSTRAPTLRDYLECNMRFEISTDAQGRTKVTPINGNRRWAPVPSRIVA